MRVEHGLHQLWCGGHVLVGVWLGSPRWGAALLSWRVATLSWWVSVRVLCARPCWGAAKMSRLSECRAGFLGPCWVYAKLGDLVIASRYEVGPRWGAPRSTVTVGVYMCVRVPCWEAATLCCLTFLGPLVAGLPYWEAMRGC